MTRRIIGLAVTLCCLAGCGSTWPVPASGDSTFSDARQCTRGGGWWRTSLGVCDVQGTGPER